jgi:hypothetical protein
MNLRSPMQTKTTSSFTPIQTGLLQRKCACGNHTVAGGECTECSKKSRLLNRNLAKEFELSGVPPIKHNTRHSPRQPLDAETSIFMEPYVRHNFTQVPTHNDARIAEPVRGQEVINSFMDAEDDPIHRPLIERFRQQEQLPSSGRDEKRAPIGPSDAEIKYRGLLMPCPRSTEVSTVIDLRAEALAAGFRTAYGIHAQMQVRPDGRTWDGTQISESLTTGMNTCPDTLTRGAPCSGGSTFTVGAVSGNSPVLAGPRHGARNRFWDFHTTHVRPQSVSVLHDAARNPANLNTCSTVCHQEYHCGGAVIGSHMITRTYKKGSHNGQNVTLVDITKT